MRWHLFGDILCTNDETPANLAMSEYFPQMDCRNIVASPDQPGTLETYLVHWRLTWYTGDLPGTLETYLAHWRFTWHTGDLPGTLETYLIHWRLTWHTGDLPGTLETYLAHWRLTWRTGDLPGTLNTGLRCISMQLQMKADLKLLCQTTKTRTEWWEFHQTIEE